MTFVMEIARRCEAAGVRVIRAAGCEARGNGQSWARYPEGIVNHHTGGPNNIYLDQLLITGRRDLSGPLTNFATLYDGDLALVAAHPANHAGASGGWDTAPCPVTRVFNREMVGNEIQYRGSEPMSPAQWRTVLIFNRIALDVIGRAGQWNRIKFHNGTSITGKWDPGFAPGKTYDVAHFRRTVSRSVEADMQQDERDALFVTMRTAQAALAQLTGSPAVGEYPGYASWVEGRPNQTLTDFGRDGQLRLQDLAAGTLALFEALNKRLDGYEQESGVAQGHPEMKQALESFRSKVDSPQP